MVGRAAVEHDAAAHPVTAHLPSSSPWRSVAALLLMLRSPGRLCVVAWNTANLVPDAARAVGVGEMRHVRDFIDLRQRRQPPQAPR